MITFKVVAVDISGNGNPRLSDVVVFGQISLFVLKAPEPSLNHDVVRPAALAVHTLADSVFADELAIAVACKLTALIRVQNLRFCYLKGLLTGPDDHCCIQSVIDIPADDIPAVPVDDRRQIKEAMFGGNVGYINRPGLIRRVDNCIAEKVRTHLCLLHPLGKVHCKIHD